MDYTKIELKRHQATEPIGYRHWNTEEFHDYMIMHTLKLIDKIKERFDEFTNETKVRGRHYKC